MRLLSVRTVLEHHGVDKSIIIQLIVHPTEFSLLIDNHGNR